jgi:hypothetical protein
LYVFSCAVSLPQVSGGNVTRQGRQIGLGIGSQAVVSSRRTLTVGGNVAPQTSTSSKVPLSTSGLVATNPFNRRQLRWRQLNVAGADRHRRQFQQRQSIWSMALFCQCRRQHLRQRERNNSQMSVNALRQHQRQC